MVLVQKWLLLELFFLGNIDQENVFYDILKRKNLSLGYKKIKVQKLKKIEIFPKEVNPWFWSKIGRFSILSFLGNTGKKNVFYDILKRKTPF